MIHRQVLLSRFELEVCHFRIRQGGVFWLMAAQYRRGYIEDAWECRQHPNGRGYRLIQLYGDADIIDIPWRPNDIGLPAQLVREELRQYANASSVLIKHIGKGAWDRFAWRFSRVLHDHDIFKRRDIKFAQKRAAELIEHYCIPNDPNVRSREYGDTSMDEIRDRALDEATKILEAYHRLYHGPRIEYPMYLGGNLIGYCYETSEYVNGHMKSHWTFSGVFYGRLWAIGDTLDECKTNVLRRIRERELKKDQSAKHIDLASYRRLPQHFDRKRFSGFEVEGESQKKGLFDSEL